MEAESLENIFKGFKEGFLVSLKFKGNSNSNGGVSGEKILEVLVNKQLYFFII